MKFKIKIKTKKKRGRKPKKEIRSGYRSTWAMFFLSGVSFLCFVLCAFPFFEPNMTVAVDDNTVVSLDLEAEITISAPADVNLGSVSGISGGSLVSNDVIWTVTTSNSAGYFLNLKKNALMSTGGGGAEREIGDYTETTSGVPDYNWVAVGSGNEALGFSPSYGADIVQNFKNNGSLCNQSGGSVSSGHCWINIPNAPASESLAYSNDATGISGAETAVKLKVEIGANNYLEGGTYSSTLTATAGTN